MSVSCALVNLAPPMFTLLETQKTAITAIIFVATFFAVLTVGRFLKRRAGVRLGVPFQLFCLTLAFYAAIFFYGVHVEWRKHVDAAAILLTTAFIVALLDRYLWDVHFEKKRQATIPQFLRQVVALFIYLIALLIVLSVVYNAETQLKGLLAGSGTTPSALVAARKSASFTRLGGMS